jgi:hypothetical protein
MLLSAAQEASLIALLSAGFYLLVIGLQIVCWSGPACVNSRGPGFRFQVGGLR